MADGPNRKTFWAFWTTLPGVLSGLAGDFSQRLAGDYHLRIANQGFGGIYTVILGVKSGP